MRAYSPVEDTVRTRVEEHQGEVWLKFRDETYTWAEVLSNIQRDLPKGRPGCNR